MLADLLDIPELVPVFPLPQVVLFPGSAIPLHIFEPRYRAMTADALLGERLIALALLKPGYEPLYHTLNAPIHATAGLGRIVDSASCDDGTYNIVLRGEARVRIVDELVGRPYRFARVEVMCSSRPPAGEVSKALRDGLCAEALRCLGDSEESQRRWKRLADGTADLDHLADLVSACLPVPAETRQSLLAECDVQRRTERLLDTLRSLSTSHCSRRSQFLGRPQQN
ncbi:MAG: LON peptidase substrate-binding domain-containing protein [Phycisphaerae bacterium]|jgi:Lon protease-like protein|nr:LON peptidase substrate-binding domain-containing protein [Phycisphaerae bacterium]MCZ2398471.1 LON peptidase substrate-binding domain-containing protein [Phycisphaerae bacterium]NUQ49690.1 LON peptidase substrate-binding domain-containing protein [Phycisphaerae bacterium]